MHTPLLQLNGVSKSFHQGLVNAWWQRNAQVTHNESERVILHNIDLNIMHGEFIAIMGPSGSGKSTLMNILGLLDRPTTGEYWIEGKSTRYASDNELADLRNQRFGFVFQSFHLLARISILENVMLPMAYAQIPTGQRQQRAKALLERLGLIDHLHKRPAQLSGGQQQRVAIARALANHAPVIFADEPTGALDTATSAEVMRILQELHEKEGHTIVLVTHEADVARYAHRQIRLKDGRITDDFPTVELQAS